MEHKPCLVGELLQLNLPEPHARTVRAAAVRCDRQLLRFWIALAPHPFEPAADCLDGELSRVARNPDTDESGVSRHVVDAVGHSLAQLLVDEVVHVYTLRIALGPIV